MRREESLGTEAAVMDDKVERCAEELGRRAKYQSQAMGLLIGLADRLGMPSDTFNPDPHQEFSLDALLQQVKLLVVSPGALNVKRLQALNTNSMDELTPGKQPRTSNNTRINGPGMPKVTSLSSSHNEF